MVLSNFFWIAGRGVIAAGGTQLPHQINRLTEYPSRYLGTQYRYVARAEILDMDQSGGVRVHSKIPLQMSSLKKEYVQGPEAIGQLRSNLQERATTLQAGVGASRGLINVTWRRPIEHCSLSFQARLSFVAAIDWPCFVWLHLVKSTASTSCIWLLWTVHIII